MPNCSGLSPGAGGWNESRPPTSSATGKYSPNAGDRQSAQPSSTGCGEGRVRTARLLRADRDDHSAPGESDGVALSAKPCRVQQFNDLWPLITLPREIAQVIDAPSMCVPTCQFCFQHDDQPPASPQHATKFTKRGRLVDERSGEGDNHGVECPRGEWQCLRPTPADRGRAGAPSQRSAG